MKMNKKPKNTLKKSTAHEVSPPKTSSSLRDLRIADVDLLITAHHLKNLGQAAQLHHMSQSAASAAIKRVEEALSLNLCMHERRQFRLTSEGELLLPKIEACIRQLRESVANPELQPLRLATTHALARACVPAVLSTQTLDLKLMRPDSAYGAIIRGEADIALVLDNAPWEGVSVVEIGQGHFQLYSHDCHTPKKAVLLPEDQIEVLTLQQRWEHMYHEPLAIKARLPSWSLIADICFNSSEVGFLPDFLAALVGLYPVSWQPMASSYRVLALYRNTSPTFLQRLETLIIPWKKVFNRPDLQAILENSLTKNFKVFS